MASTTQSKNSARVIPAADKAEGTVLQLPRLIHGSGVFGTDYNSLDDLHSDIPRQTLLECFRSGITALDTSPYYTTSEAVVGKALQAIKDEFPRSSYQIITKAGRYGRTKETGFDYSRDRVRSSVQNSLDLLGTDYLDGVYMHDVEFMAENVGGANDGGQIVDENGEIRPADFGKWGLSEGNEAKVHGPGDEKVLEAMAALFELKKEGKIRAVGFSGYPLPAMLRLARLIAAKLQPLDIMQSYCHHTLQNTTLSTYIPLFKAAGVKQVISASPLSMGLLRTAGGQHWHPASPELKEANKKVLETFAEKGVKLEDVALGFGFNSAALGDDAVPTPIVIGCSTPAEVQATLDVYSKIYSHTGDSSSKGRRPGQGLSDANKEQLELERIATGIYKESGTYNWVWGSGVASGL